MPRDFTHLEGFSLPSKKRDEKNELSGIKKKHSGKGGGFQGLGLDFNVLKGIRKKGYKVPTPIQRKSIPIVMSGRDVVAMARTGSGKTACFLIPMFERLKCHSPATGARALILSPTRELAIQTYKFVRDLGKYLDLRAILVLGGESMDYQFSKMHANPDIIIATPGRFYHLCVEMDLKLKSIEYIVFDEADRLFEMGFGEQVKDILQMLPDSRQTVLFSATLPRVLVDFARAGLNDPVLLRLDVEANLPELLNLVFLYCKDEDKPAALVVLLKQIISNGAKTAVFAATKQHVEYLHLLLEKSHIPSTYVYSDLDPAARKINVARFAKGLIKVLVVTDIAARGIDIPFLDNVINFSFPAKAKLFVHRVGRCARAGRSGTAYTLVSRSEMPYFLDLQLFLGRGLQKAKPLVVKKEEVDGNKVDDIEDGVIGYIPRSFLEEEQANLDMYNQYPDLEKLKISCQKAYTQYLRHRPGASVESVRRHKELCFEVDLGPHPIFRVDGDLSLEKDKEQMLIQMKLLRPKGTIFELGRNPDLPMFHAMKEKRKIHATKIEKFHDKLEQSVLNGHDTASKPISNLPSSSQKDIDDTFSTVIDSVKEERTAKAAKKRKIMGKSVDEKHYIPYDPADKHVEAGLAVNFAHDANSAVLDLTADTNELMRQKRQLMKWDAKRKKMVQVNPEKKVTIIKTESGQRIRGSYKTGRYEKWQHRNKIEKTLEEDENDDNSQQQIQSLPTNPHTHWGRRNMKLAQKQKNLMLRTKEQIAKRRMMRDTQLERQKGREGKKGRGKGQRQRRE